MSRGKCEFKTMDMGSPGGDMEEKGMRDPFYHPDIEDLWDRGKLNPSAYPSVGIGMPAYDPRNNKKYIRRVQLGKPRLSNDKYFEMMGEGRFKDTKDVTEREEGVKYVDAEEAFGREPIVEDYSKSANIGDILNKAFDDE